MPASRVRKHKPKTLTRAQTMEAVVRGIERANAFYEKVSGLFWLNDTACEGMVVGHVANEISRRSRGKTLTTLEASFKDLVEYSSARKNPGRTPKAIASNGRIDLALWRNDSDPIGLIEIKRSYTPANLNNDINRLKALIKKYGRSKNGSLRFGCVGVFVSDSSNKVSNRNFFKSLVESASSLTDQEFTVHCEFSSVHKFKSKKYKESYNEYKHWRWGAACFYMTMKKPKSTLA